MIQTRLNGFGAEKARCQSLVCEPQQTGYAAVSDDWYGITPGMMVYSSSVIRELMIAGKIDVEYLTRYTNAPYLVIEMKAF